MAEVIITNSCNWNNIFEAPRQANMTFKAINIKIYDGSVLQAIRNTRVDMNEAITIKVPHLGTLRTLKLHPCTDLHARTV